MALRITRQNIEALIQGQASEARVSRAYIQVLVNTQNKEANASNTITVTQEVIPLFQIASSTIVVAQTVTPAAPRNVAATNAILVTQAVEYIGPRDVEATSTLTITNSCRVPQVFEESITSTIAVTLTADAGHRALSQQASNTITITQFVDTSIIERPALSILAIAQTALGTVTSKSSQAVSVISVSQSAVSSTKTPTTSNTIAVVSMAIGTNTAVHVAATSTLDFINSVVSNTPSNVEASNTLTTFEFEVDPITGQIIKVYSGLTSTAIADVIKFNRKVSSVINLTQEVIYEVDGTNYYERQADSIITITGSVDRDFTSESVIIITDLAEYELMSQPRNELVITQTAVPQMTLNRPASSTISVAQTVTYDIVGRFNRCTYSPFIGSSTDPDAPTPPATIAPVTSRADSVILERGSDVLTLRLPELGNRDRLDFTRIHRESRGGRLEVFADPIWPKTENMQLTFIGMCQQEINDILTFISNTLGQEIIIHDWENRSWYGYITNPTVTAVRDKREIFTIALELDVIEDAAQLAGGANVITVTQIAIAEVV